MLKLRFKPLIELNAMNFLIHISNCYNSTACKRCLRCLFYPVEVITLIIKHIFKVLQLIYERTFYTQEERELRKLNKLNELNEYLHQHKNELKKAFLHLGAMNVVVDMEDPDELLQKMNKDNTGSNLFKTSYSRRKALRDYIAYFSEMNKKYIEGKHIFKCINNAIKSRAQRQNTEINITDANQLTGFISQIKIFPDSPEGKSAWALLPIVVQAHFVEFQILFQQNLSLEQAASPDWTKTHLRISEGNDK